MPGSSLSNQSYELVYLLSKDNDYKGKNFKLIYSPTIVKFGRIQITEFLLSSSTVFLFLLLNFFN